MGAATRRRRLLALLLVCSAVGSLNTGCTRYTNSGSSSSSNAGNSAGCAELLANARNYARNGQTGDGRLNWTIDELAYRCEREYDIFIDEDSGAAEHPAQQELADGPASRPQGSISWSQAINHVGSTEYVCGPLVNSGISGDDVFLNLGLGYPNVERFTIVIWDIGGLESISKGVTLCTTGTITLYQETAQIELRSASDVEIWE